MNYHNIFVIKYRRPTCGSPTYEIQDANEQPLMSVDTSLSTPHEDVYQLLDPDNLLVCAFFKKTSCFTWEISVRDPAGVDLGLIRSSGWSNKFKINDISDDPIYSIKRTKICCGTQYQIKTINDKEVHAEVNQDKHTILNIQEPVDAQSKILILACAFEMMALKQRAENSKFKEVTAVIIAICAIIKLVLRLMRD